MYIRSPSTRARLQGCVCSFVGHWVLCMKEVDERILLNLMDLMTESEYLDPDRPSRAPTSVILSLPVVRQEGQAEDNRLLRLQLHKPTSCFRTYLFNDRRSSASVPIPGPSSHLTLKEEEASISRGVPPGPTPPLSKKRRDMTVCHL